MSFPILPNNYPPHSNKNLKFVNMRLPGSDQGSSIRITPGGANLNGKAELRKEGLLVGNNFQNAGHFTSNGAPISVQKNFKNTGSGVMIINASKKIENWASKHPWRFMLISIFIGAVIGTALDRLVLFLFPLSSN